MDILKKLIPVFFTVLLLTGCYSDIDLDVKSNPVLCLNSLITPGDSIHLQVTRTWEWTENYYYTDTELYVEDAEVAIYVNGNFIQKMTSRVYNIEYAAPWDKPITAFTCDYIPKSGDVIRFEAKSQKYGEANAEVTVPYPVKIDKIDYNILYFSEMESGYLKGKKYSMSLELKAWFTDPEDTTDYYKLVYPNDIYWLRTDIDKEENPIGVITCSEIDESSEPLLTEHVSVLESILSETSGYTIFSDRQISGKSYPLHISIGRLSIDLDYPYDESIYEDMGINIILKRISASYYNHVLSVWIANDGISGILGNVGLNEPVYALSNVSTGAGVIAADAPYEYKVLIKDLIEKGLEME